MASGQGGGGGFEQDVGGLGRVPTAGRRASSSGMPAGMPPSSSQLTVLGSQPQPPSQGAGAYGPGGYNLGDFNFSTAQGYAPQPSQAQPTYPQPVTGPSSVRPMPSQPQQVQGLPLPAQSMPPPYANPTTMQPPQPPAPGPQQFVPSGPVQVPSYAGQPPPQQAGVPLMQSRPASAQPQQQPMAPAPAPLPRSLSRQSSVQQLQQLQQQHQAMAAGMVPPPQAPQPSPAVLPPPQGVLGVMPAAPPRPSSRGSLSGDINSSSIPQQPHSIQQQQQQPQGPALPPHELARIGPALERPSSRGGGVPPLQGQVLPHIPGGGTQAAEPSYTPDFTEDDEDDDVSSSQRSPRRDKYTGDVSAWGRRRVPNFYNNKSVSESNFTMSSGLSPRDTKPREREFDIDQAKKVPFCIVHLLSSEW
ncbi:hypothetical protein DUNSADRAFT_7647 [Dunaliella salina]|uniref:Uncharacterized protein n=1 Tax=Dunaliella salina TaxID=3046 RepID=A0ABQ7H645_DUNSA|nr:hypothetical protein DUNSADRAFT_7647 [Dunaliella salina]|eukprot:KAF5842333.1 hypothetical protein DUNSADRAFT_7647 [Dunaliella salina]